MAATCHRSSARRSRRAALTCAVAISAITGAGALAGCSSNTPRSSGERLAVVASFYPLQYAAERIGGSRVSVTNLTKPGAEPHDVELTPREVIEVAKSRLAIYEKGLQPAVDEAISQNSPDNAFDVSSAARLDLFFDRGLGGSEHADEHSPTDGHDHAADDGDHEDAGEEGHEGEEGLDPHFSLDPTRYADVARAIAERLAEVDPAGAQTYRTNAQALVTELTALDADFRTGLASCQRRQLVTAHAAFGYLAHRYGLTQVPIAGISPDSEPDPATLAAISEYTREHRITTIYTETLASPAVAQTVAAETGAKTAVLDPLEGITAESPGRSYPEVMRANLATLRAGQGCS